MLCYDDMTMLSGLVPVFDEIQWSWIFSGPLDSSFLPHAKQALKYEYYH